MMCPGSTSNSMAVAAVGLSPSLARGITTVFLQTVILALVVVSMGMGMVLLAATLGLMLLVRALDEAPDGRHLFSS